VPFGPARETTKLPGPGEAWLEPRVFGQLNARVGDRVHVGQTELTITRFSTIARTRARSSSISRRRC
jgi:putative ABC transport system permease protein